MVGRIVGQTYRILAPIAKGGLGSLYVAEHIRFGRKFAIMFLSDEFVGNQEAFMRFRRETERAGQLRHLNIIDVMDFNVTDEGVPYLVMERLEGENLAQRLGRAGAMHPDEAQVILEQVADAVDVEQCIQGKMKQWRFPMLKKGILRVTCSFTLEPLDKKGK